MNGQHPLHTTLLNRCSGVKVVDAASGEWQFCETGGNLAGKGNGQTKNNRMTLNCNYITPKAFFAHIVTVKVQSFFSKYQLHFFPSIYLLLLFFFNITINYNKYHTTVDLFPRYYHTVWFWYCYIPNTYTRTSAAYLFAQNLRESFSKQPHIKTTQWMKEYLAGQQEC